MSYDFASLQLKAIDKFLIQIAVIVIELKFFVDARP